MEKFLLLGLGGAIGGVLGGMGMGGGTLLIPILTIFFDFKQVTAQSYNLFSFIPMAVIALVLHAKNKLINMKGMTVLALFAAGFSALGSFLVKNVEGNIQTKLFGVFLTLLSILKFVGSVKANKKEILK